MSQEFLEDKEPVLVRLSGRQRLFEALLLLMTIFAIFMMVSLVSFNPADPSWSQTAWHGPVKNIGGNIGAWLADTLFFVFGVLAYAIPPVMVATCWVLYRRRNASSSLDYFTFSLRTIGLFSLILCSCGLAAMSVDDWYYFASGGVIGSLLTSTLVSLMQHLWATLTLLVVWCIGLTLFTGWSWLVISEKIGAFIMGCLTFLTNRSRRYSDRRISNSDDEYDPEFKDVTSPAGAVASASQEDDVLFSIQSIKAGEDSTERAVPLIEQPQQDSLFDNIPINNASLDGNNIENSAISPVVKVNELVLDHSDKAIAAYDQAPNAEAIAPEIQKNEVIYRSIYPSLNTEKKSDAQPATEINWHSAQFDDVEHNEVAFKSTHDEPAQNIEQYGDRLIQDEAIKSEANKGDVYKAEYVAESKPTISEGFSTLQQIQQQGNGSHLSSYKQDDVAEPIISSFNPVPEHLNNSEYPGSLEEGTDAGPFGIVDSDDRAKSGLAAATAFSATMANTSFGPGTPQVKQGIGPELPRPKPVRIPTRRELASSGIKLPSQREAELREDKRAIEPEANLSATIDNVSLDDDAQYQQEQDALAREFEQIQRVRYEADSVNEAKSEYHQTEIEDIHADSTHIEPRFTFPGQLSPATVPIVEAVRVEPTTVEPAKAIDVPQVNSPLSNLHQPHSVLQPAESAHSVANHSAPVAPAIEIPQSTNPSMEGLIHPFLMRNERPLEKPNTPLPTLDLLTSPPATQEPVDMELLEETARLIERRLGDFRVKARVVDILPGPVITRFELDLAPGVKAARISSLARDLARSLSVIAVRVVEVIPGKPYVGLELPNEHRQTVYMREVLNGPEFTEAASPLTVVLGKDISGQPVVADLAKMPHLLVAGTTGSGKSVGVNAMILSILYKATEKEVRFIMIDPKMLELSVYEGIPHLLTEVVTDMKDASNALRWCVNEMERRYKLMSALGVRNLAGYNERVQQAIDMGRPIPDPFWKQSDSMGMTPPELDKLPYIVVMVDEFADLMMAVGKKVEELIARLAQKARAAGIHLVLATQRPSVDVITGLIKANIPTRIAFTVSSKIDSRTILDQGGAESLLGMGDMLYLPPNSSTPMRVHGAFVRDQEVHAVVQDWKARGRPQYIESITATAEEGENGAFGGDGFEELDALFDQAVAFVIEKRKPSISGIQRQFRIGYNRAARIIDQMENKGIVSPPGHNGNREVLARSGEFD